jgi:glycine dehydrogenase
MTDFAVRHIGPTPAEQGHMLGSLGFSSLDELTTAALPAGTPPAGLHLPDPLTETEALAELRRMAGRNQVLTSMIGLGYYDTITPAVIRRNVLENPAWYTAYTPYQPEISQGRLEALLNFQTTVADLTGLPWAGASLLDEATAAVEAMTLTRRAAKKGHVFLADADCLPQTLAVLRTRAEPLGIHLVVEPVTPEAIARLGGDLFGVLLQFPGASGVIRDPAPLIEAAHAAGHPAQRVGEPRLVHGVHPVPARDQPGPPRGTAQFPDGDWQSHRPADCERLTPRRRHRCR